MCRGWDWKFLFEESDLTRNVSVSLACVSSGVSGRFRGVTASTKWLCWDDELFRNLLGSWLGLLGGFRGVFAEEDLVLLLGLDEGLLEQVGIL